MKLSRNDPCACGSGKKYKRCCMNNMSKQHAKVFDDIDQVVAMNPNLTLDELEAVMQHKVHEGNNSANPDFCGLSPAQMGNWLYAPLDELNDVTIHTPCDLSASPVMRYLTLIFDEAIRNDGSFKATSKGNLPVKLVKQASALISEFAVSEFEQNISLSEFAGSNEDKFNALHYTRILAELTGIIYRRSGRYHIKKAAQKQYLSQGIQAFFKPMLQAVITKYNWCYLDLFGDNIDLRLFWLFMLWRLQSHASAPQLINEVAIAFPNVLEQLDLEYEYAYEIAPIDFLGMVIETRFIERFLQYWGFITVNPRRFRNGERIEMQTYIQPLLTKTFQFNIKN